VKLELSIAVQMPEGGQMAQASVVERVIGAARLDPRAYEDVERDEAATGTALAIVVLSAIANGIGNLGNDGVIGLIVGVVFGVIGFVLYAGIAYLVGAKLFATAETRVTWGQLIRTLGFAQAPGIGDPAGSRWTHPVRCRGVDSRRLDHRYPASLRLLDRAGGADGSRGVDHLLYLRCSAGHRSGATGQLNERWDGTQRWERAGANVAAEHRLPPRHIPKMHHAIDAGWA